VADYEEWENANKPSTVAAFLVVFGLTASHQKKLSSAVGGWRHPDTKTGLLKSAGKARRMNLIQASGPNRRPWQELEDELYDEIMKLRTDDAPRKVSGAWIRANARLLSLRPWASKPTKPFKASSGWLVRFTRARGLRYRKRQKGNVGNVAIQVDRMLKWMKKFVFMLRTLPNALLTDEPSLDVAKWGRFLPKYRYNVDQVREEQ
jgi:hypothetical protein